MNFTKISRELLKSLNFHVMSDFERNGFAGAMSPVSLIADNEDEGICVIIDGARAELYAYDGCANFDMIDAVESVRDLPFKSQRDLEIERRIKNLKEELAALENELCY